MPCNHMPCNRTSRNHTPTHNMLAYIKAAISEAQKGIIFLSPNPLSRPILHLPIIFRLCLPHPFPSHIYLHPHPLTTYVTLPNLPQNIWLILIYFPLKALKVASVQALAQVIYPLPLSFSYLPIFLAVAFLLIDTTNCLLKLQ